MIIIWKPSCNSFVIIAVWKDCSIIKYLTFAADTFNFSAVVEEQNNGKVLTYFTMIDQKEMEQLKWIYTSQSVVK